MFNHIHLDTWLHAMQKDGLLIFVIVFAVAAVRAFLTPKQQRTELKSMPLQDDIKETPRPANPPRHEN